MVLSQTQYAVITDNLQEPLPRKVSLLNLHMPVLSVIGFPITLVAHSPNAVVTVPPALKVSSVAMGSTFSDRLMYAHFIMLN